MVDEGHPISLAQLSENRRLSLVVQPASHERRNFGVLRAMVLILAGHRRLVRSTGGGFVARQSQSPARPSQPLIRLEPAAGPHAMSCVSGT